MDDDALSRLRALCLALPEAAEMETWGEVPTFRVRDKIFAMVHAARGRPSLWCKAPPGAQEAYIGSEPERFFVPPYVGQHGWLGIWLDVPLDWDEGATLITDAYRMTAPKRLIARMD